MSAFWIGMAIGGALLLGAALTIAALVITEWLQGPLPFMWSCPVEGCICTITSIAPDEVTEQMIVGHMEHHQREASDE